jgi:hypothetical protein
MSAVERILGGARHGEARQGKVRVETYSPLSGEAKAMTKQQLDDLRKAGEELRKRFQRAEPIPVPPRFVTPESSVDSVRDGIMRLFGK